MIVEIVEIVQECSNRMYIEQTKRRFDYNGLRQKKNQLIMPSYPRHIYGVWSPTAKSFLVQNICR